MFNFKTTPFLHLVNNRSSPSQKRQIFKENDSPNPYKFYFRVVDQNIFRKDLAIYVSGLEFLVGSQQKFCQKDAKKGGYNTKMGGATKIYGAGKGGQQKFRFQKKYSSAPHIVYEHSLTLRFRVVFKTPGGYSDIFMDSYARCKWEGFERLMQIDGWVIFQKKCEILIDGWV